MISADRVDDKTVKRGLDHWTITPSESAYV